MVNKGATTPTVDTTKNGKNAVAGENVITLNNLTAGAREIYIIVKNAGGVESAALKVDIPAFGGGTEQPGEFKITISAPKGGTLTASKTTAGAGDNRYRNSGRGDAVGCRLSYLYACRSRR